LKFTVTTSSGQEPSIKKKEETQKKLVKKEKIRSTRKKIESKRPFKYFIIEEMGLRLQKKNE